MLNDRAKSILKRNKNKLEKNDLIAVYKEAAKISTEDVGDITEFLFACGVNVWQYVDIVMPYMFSEYKLDTLDIPEGITKIASNAFVYSDIKTINIPSTITKIGSKAFMGCTKLKQLYLPESVVSIDADAFYDCENIKIRTPRRQVHNKLRLPKNEIDWYKQHLVFIDQSEEEE